MPIVVMMVVRMRPATHCRWVDLECFGLTAANRAHHITSGCFTLPVRKTAGAG
jgi:hypothetical protein